MAWPRSWRRHRTPATVLPTFIVIGANKGGTTSLWQYLDQHPDVYMSRNKEPMYFSNAPAREGRPDQALRSEVVRTWEEYLQLFGPGQGSRAVGEASTSYLCNPSVPARIHADLPDVQLLAVLRNPFDRAFSAFQMYRRLGMETLSFPEAVESELDRFDGGTATGPEWRTYLHLGFYGRALTRYLEFFPRRQLGIHLYEDFEAAPLELMADLYRFIGVDPAFRPNIDTRHNAAPTREVPEWDPGLRDRILGHLEPDIRIVEQLVDRDLSSWRRPTPLGVADTERPGGG
jgi:hypothetical protein